MKIHYHEADLPAGLDFGKSVAIDSETMGLNPQRDGLCVAQLSAGDGHCHILRFDRKTYGAPNFIRLLTDPEKELLDVDMSKQQQSSDWGATKLSDAQLSYAASDVLHLHKLKAALEAMLIREGRLELALACFAFLPTRTTLDLNGWAAE